MEVHVFLPSSAARLDVDTMFFCSRPFFVYKTLHFINSSAEKNRGTRALAVFMGFGLFLATIAFIYRILKQSPMCMYYRHAVGEIKLSSAISC